MADWFKFFENGLDEPRFQYAVGTLSEVTPVWVGILSECCRHKSDSIGWDDDEAYLFGFSRRLNVSIPKVKEAINLLVRINYISVLEGRLTVLKWNDFHSEYMRKKARLSESPVQTVSRHTPDNVRLEERRGDKKEETEKKDSAIAVNPEHQAFIKGWSENFEAAHKVKYQFEGGRDGKAVKELLGMGILRIDLLEIAKKAWAWKANLFLAGRSLTIYGFRENFNAIQTGVINGNKNGGTYRNEVDRNAGTANQGRAKDYAKLRPPT